MNAPVASSSVYPEVADLEFDDRSIASLVADLGEVQETLFIPLWARAEDARRENSILSDKQASEILERSGYDTSRFSQAIGSQVGCCIRSLRFDALTRDWLNDNPKGVVIELGPGLDDRRSRCDAHERDWIEVDFPDVMRLRQRLLDAGSQCHQIVSAIESKRWLAKAREIVADRAVLVVAEGVLPYFDTLRVQRLFAEIAESFTRSSVVFDLIHSAFMPFQRFHDAHRHFAAHFTWALPSAKAVERWASGYRILVSYTLADASPAAYRQLPRYMRYAYAVMPLLKRLYAFHHVRLSGGDDA